MKKVFIICSVRKADEDHTKKIYAYAEMLEKKGYEVHLPPRDTDQKASGYDICLQNCQAIAQANEVHIFYNPESQGTHFDMGVAFAYGRKIVVVENVEYEEGKSYPRMLDEWAAIFINKDMDEAKVVNTDWFVTRSGHIKEITKKFNYDNVKRYANDKEIENADKINTLVDELLELKFQHQSIYKVYGSELCSGEMITKEEAIEDKIEKLRK